MMTGTEWTPDRKKPKTTWPMPTLWSAIGRGLLCRCPACGESRMFNGYLRVVPECRNCGAPLGLARADDAPPYFTIFVVGHIVIPLMMYVDRVREPSVAVMTAIFVPMTLILALVLLRPIKGGTVGLMVNLNMLKTDPNGS